MIDVSAAADFINTQGTFYQPPTIVLIPYIWKTIHQNERDARILISFVVFILGNANFVVSDETSQRWKHTAVLTDDSVTVSRQVLPLNVYVLLLSSFWLISQIFK